jgi:hypothetical protein
MNVLLKIQLQSQNCSPKEIIIMNPFINPSAGKWILLLTASLSILTSCNKIDWINPDKKKDQGHLKQTKTFSSDGVQKWLQFSNRLLLATQRVAPGVKSNREFGYVGIALYEAVVPGMPSYRSLAGQLQQMPSMPLVTPGSAYHWPSSANAALAAMNRFFFSTTSAANMLSLDSLETALNAEYQKEANTEIIQRSIEFGKEVAERIINWSTTDGSDHAFDSYSLPAGPGLWVPTPSAFGIAVAPYWKNNRLFVSGSLDGALPPPPVEYSESPSSDFYKMYKEVYDVSVSLTPEQRAIGLFWLDASIGAGGHWQSIVKQVLAKEKSSLDIAALAYAKGGIYINDATISSFKTKYTYNRMRPITYIRTVLNQPTWNSLFATPGHPDYSSAHTVQSIAIAGALSSIFGSNYQFTDHTFDDIGMAARSYSSFEAVAQEVAVARVYAGIHTRLACEAGLVEGLKVAENIDHKLKFKK